MDNVFCPLGWEMNRGWRHVVKISGSSSLALISGLISLGRFKRCPLRWSLAGPGLGLEELGLESFEVSFRPMKTTLVG